MSIQHVTLSLWCLLATALMPLICAYIAKMGAFKLSDNKDPRQWALRQTGWRARALAAQANCFEAFPLFACGVIVAHLMEASQMRLDALSVAYVLFRVVFISAYLRDKSTLRSIVWLGAFCVNLSLFFIAS